MTGNLLPIFRWPSLSLKFQPEDHLNFQLASRELLIYILMNIKERNIFFEKVVLEEKMGLLLNSHFYRTVKINFKFFRKFFQNNLIESFLFFPTQFDQLSSTEFFSLFPPLKSARFDHQENNEKFSDKLEDHCEHVGAILSSIWLRKGNYWRRHYLVTVLKASKLMVIVHYFASKSLPGNLLALF